MTQLQIPNKLKKYCIYAEKIDNGLYRENGYEYVFKFDNELYVQITNLTYHYRKGKNIFETIIYKNGQLLPCKLNNNDVLFLTNTEVIKVLKKVKEGKINEQYN